MEDQYYDIQRRTEIKDTAREMRRKYLRYKDAEHLKKVIAGEAELPERKTESREPEQPPKEKRRFDLVVDIQEKMAQGKNGGYVRWAKKYNV